MYQQGNENEIVVSAFPVGNCYHVSVHGLKILSSIIIARSNRISPTELEIRFVLWIVIYKRVSYFTVFVYRNRAHHDAVRSVEQYFAIILL